MGIEELSGSIRWSKTSEVQSCTTRLFKSGNALIVRIPVGTLLTAGMEVEVKIEDGQFVSVKPVHSPKRKFNVAKVAGSVPGLRYISSEDRLFEERPSDRVARDDVLGDE